MKKNKGITLVALVVTLVVLLILAGITMQLIMTDTGIFSKAQQAKQAQEIGELKDRISAHILDWSADKVLQEGISIDNLWDKLVADNIIDNPEEDVKKSDEADNIYEITTNKGYIVEIIVNDDGSVSIGDIVKGDELPPKINKIEVTSKTTNSIEVLVTVSRFENGKLSYYYKKDTEPESSYKKLKENTTDMTASFVGLEQNVIYNIKVLAENKNGKVEKVVNEITRELASGTITQKGTTAWSNGTANIELETSATGIEIQYKINSDGTWQTYTGAITGLYHGDIVYARIYDGVNSSDDSTINITDEIAPTVTENSSSSTTDSVILAVTVVDNESGIAESPTYTFYRKLHTEPDTSYIKDQENSNNSYTKTGLAQNTTYTIKVEINDKAGNTGSFTKNLTTKSYPLLRDIASAGSYIRYTVQSQSYELTTEQTGYSNQIFNTSEYTGLWQVLYDYKTYGRVEIISSDVVTSTNIYLNGKVGYNNLVSTLNTASRNYVNSTYATSGRSVGSNPTNPSGTDILFKNTSAGGQYSYITKYAGDMITDDSLYTTDYNQMKSLNIHNLGKYYWLASRSLYTCSGSTDFKGRFVTDGGIDSASSGIQDLWNLYVDGKNNSHSDGHRFRPVILLKSDLKVTGGDGTSTNPYILQQT